MKSESFVLSAWMTVAHVCLLAILVSLLAVRLNAPNMATGWWAGTIIGLIDYLIMYFLIIRNADKPAHKAFAGMRKGWIIRFAFVTISVLLSFKYGFAMAAVMIAILAVHAITLIDAVWLAYRRSKLRT